MEKKLKKRKKIHDIEGNKKKQRKKINTWKNYEKKKKNIYTKLSEKRIDKKRENNHV